MITAKIVTKGTVWYTRSQGTIEALDSTCSAPMVVAPNFLLSCTMSTASRSR